MAVAAALKKASDLAARVQRAPNDFAKIARESSEHKDSAAKGGDLGWVPETQLIPEIRAAVVRMTKGELSPPIRSASGWHIVRLDRSQAERHQAFERSARDHRRQHATAQGSRS